MKVALRQNSVNLYWGVKITFLFQELQLLIEIAYLVFCLTYLVFWLAYLVFYLRICVYISQINLPQSSTFRVLCGKKSAGLKKVHHRRLWRL